MQTFLTRFSGFGCFHCRFRSSATDPIKIGYAANLNVGDSVVNLTNDGWPRRPLRQHHQYRWQHLCEHLCVRSSGRRDRLLRLPDHARTGSTPCRSSIDLISNNLTPAVPTSVVIKLVGSYPTAAGGLFTGCNASTVAGAVAAGPPPYTANIPVPGLIAWGSTLEPASTPGTYGTVHVPFRDGSHLGTGALTAGVADELYRSRSSATSSRATGLAMASASPAVWALWAARSSNR